jgi:hypothetical protein
MRFALTPRLLLLLTWLDDFGPEPIMKMPIDLVRNHNSSVIEQAETQWFHHPDRGPERMRGPWPLMAFHLHGAAYNPRGHRWSQVQAAVQEMTPDGEPEPDIRLIHWGVPRSVA